MFSRRLAVPVVATGPLRFGIAALDDASIGARTPVRANSVTPLSPAAGVRRRNSGSRVEIRIMHINRRVDAVRRIRTGVKSQAIVNEILDFSGFFIIHPVKGAPPDSSTAASIILRWTSGSRTNRTASASIFCPRKMPDHALPFLGHPPDSPVIAQVATVKIALRRAANSAICGAAATPAEPPQGCGLIPDRGMIRTRSEPASDKRRGEHGRRNAHQTGSDVSNPRNSFPTDQEGCRVAARDHCVRGRGVIGAGAAAIRSLADPVCYISYSGLAHRRHCAGALRRVGVKLRSASRTRRSTRWCAVVPGSSKARY